MSNCRAPPTHTVKRREKERKNVLRGNIVDAIRKVDSKSNPLVLGTIIVPCMSTY